MFSLWVSLKLIFLFNVQTYWNFLWKPICTLVSGLKEHLFLRFTDVISSTIKIYDLHYSQLLAKLLKTFKQWISLVVNIFIREITLDAQKVSYCSLHHAASNQVISWQRHRNLNNGEKKCNFLFGKDLEVVLSSKELNTFDESPDWASTVPETSSEMQDEESESYDSAVIWVIFL